jgi:hypothetical protein
MPTDREWWRTDVRLGLRDQEARWPATVLTFGTSTRATVHMSDRVDRVKMVNVRVERGLEDLAADRSRTAVTRVEWRGTRMEYATHGRFVGWASKPSVADFTRLGLKIRVEVPKRNRRHVVASRSSHRGEAISWKARWPSDEDYLGLDHNALGAKRFYSKYLGAKLGLCDNRVK